MDIKELVEAAKEHAKKVLSNPDYTPYRERIKIMEERFKEDAKKQRCSSSWYERSYWIDE